MRIIALVAVAAFTAAGAAEARGHGGLQPSSGGSHESSGRAGPGGRSNTSPIERRRA
jgi:hypothetical protein